MLEVRYVPSNVTLNDNVILGIGSEHCSIQFMSELSTFIRSDAIKSHNFRIVTPKTDQQNFASVVDLLEKALSISQPLSIVVNDFGVLYYFKNRSINLTLGRVLSGSFGYRATMESFIHPQEDPSIVFNTLAPSILHRKKIELYKGYGVTSVEVSPMRHEDEYINLLKQYGVDIHIHYASFVSAISKICYCLGYDKNDKPICIKSCKKPQKLELAHMPNYNPTSRSSMLEEEFKKKQNEFPNYYLAGNVIYYIEDRLKITNGYYDTIIYDCRYIKDNTEILFK